MKDLREWMTKAEELGELKTIPGVSWDLEMGVVSEHVERQMENPAILFDDIPGYPQGFRVLINSLGSRNRFCMTIGFPTGLKELDIVQEWRRRHKALKFLPPRFVNDGPVMENVFYGKEIDLLSLPVPKWHEMDGGRYIGTGDSIITKGLKEDWVNLGTYRVMVHDRNQVGIHIGWTHHGRWHMKEWFDRGEAMPIAIVVGMDPVLFLVSFLEVPQGVSEYDYAGALRGEPVEVMRGPKTGLPIPAGAEIVLEGFVDPKEQRPEGPFGEFPGYYAGGVAEQPLIRVEGLYYRNNPIILGAPALKPPNARNYYRGALSSAIIWDALESARVPGVVGVWSYDFGFRLTVVAIKQRYPGHAKHAARVAALIPHANRYMVVVDEDIDITDLNDVMWAMCTRVDAGKDIEFLSDCISTSLDPIIPPERKGYPVTTRVIIDAARPYDWRDRFPLVSTSSPELSQQILSRLGKVLESAGIRLKGPAN